MAKNPASSQGAKPAPLTAATLRRLRLLFAPDDWAEATRLLLVECGNSLPHLERATPSELARFRYAALRLSGGRLAGLRVPSPWRRPTGGTSSWRRDSGMT